MASFIRINSFRHLPAIIFIVYFFNSTYDVTPKKLEITLIYGWER